ncbi:potassium channel family protein [Chthonobacter rhizosphaerae]|uniref:potassium channel family protein n=1 Tax=Chthonobacter rhizosphaerae TaxID=2735553 RepID=UPI0015EF4A66|nr:potassium channel family protein [Chthonobacter rhizosphaerae]
MDLTGGRQTRSDDLRTRVRRLYHGDSPEAHRFRYALVIIDIAVILFIVATSFVPRSIVIEVLDVVFGLMVLTDFLARLWISHRPWRDLIHPTSLADLAAILSFLAPLIGEGAAFLRILRTVRFLHTYQLMRKLREDFTYFRKHEEVLVAAVHFCVFLYVMTGIVYETQHARNEDINNWVDALYFTVTSLTTTGFGDITLEGTTGRLLSVIIMIAGVTLFLRLAQVLFRPNKVRFECTVCGLYRHDPDAVHCKHCGTVLHLPTEGYP